MCPLHKRNHDSDNMWAKVTKKCIRVACYRRTTDEKHLDIILKKKEETTKIDVIDSLIQEC
jgi:hypothetical protein